MAAAMEQPPPPEFPSEPPLGPPLPPVPPGSVRSALPWSEPPAPAGAPRRRGPLVAAAVALVVLLVAGFLVVRAATDDAEVAGDREPRPAPETTATTDDAPATTDEPAATTTTAPPTEEEFEAVVDEIEHFVEDERGLSFQRPPIVQLADDQEFEDALLADFDEDADALALAGRTLEAIGLLEPGTDLVATYRTLLGAGVVGFYDPETERLLVRGTSTSPYVRTVIAHELTHALDDQHFDLSRPDLDESHDEQGVGFSALVEGDAVHVEDAYRATFTPAEEEAAAQEELALGTDPRLFDVPLPLIEALQMPYTAGPDLVSAILGAGGQPRLDTSFAVPPITSEQMLDPDAYLEGEGPVALPTPTPDGPETDHGVLGALGIAQLLGKGPLLNPGPLDPAVVGWGGDQYVTWIGPEGQACLRAAIVGDTPEDTAELLDALQRWTTTTPIFSTPVDATVAGGADGAPITLTSCALG
jgi:hypothetical protein